eukprot:g6612.t1
MGNIKEWISDKLHDLLGQYTPFHVFYKALVLGYSESNVVNYILALSKKSSNSLELSEKLQEQGLPNTSQTTHFAEALLSRLPQSGTDSSQSRNAVSTSFAKFREEQNQARSFLMKNAQYDLLEEEDEHPSTSEMTRSKSEKKLRRKRDRLMEIPEVEEEEETPVVKKTQAKKPWQLDQHKESNSDDEKNRERLRDLKEKEEFEERLRIRDEEKTKRLMEKKLSKEEQQEANRRNYTSRDEKESLVPKLREYSRQEYLGKREDQKIQELRDMIEDEQFLFSGVQLTEMEKQDLQKKRKLLELAESHKKQIEKMKVEGYHMPESYDESTKEGRDKKQAAMYERYHEEEDEDEATPWKEQERWEGAQLKKTKMQVGTREQSVKSKSYELVMEDQIDFIKHEYLTGDRSLEDDDQDEIEMERRRKAEEQKSERESIALERSLLPIYPYRDELLNAIAEHQVLIIVAETGAGKTTQIPQYLHEAGYSQLGKIGCTQPRRVAAMSVASRVARELNVKLGNEVGYSIRFEDCTSDKTIIKYMTDGMLLREFLGEPDLSSYSVMIIDEAHERTLHTDVLFGLVKDIARFRPDLKLLISSATLDAEKFSDYFDSAPIFKVPGRRYPVDIFYTKAPEADYVDAAVVTCLQVHVKQPLGDVLVFFTGQEEIEAAEELLKERTKGLGSKIGELIICPIYGNLPTELQSKIFEPTPIGARKIVLATNIAETSLTVDGIKYVVDTGLVKQKSYNPRTGMEQLMVTPISKASALQRSGRAGRTAPGKCYRLYTAWSYEHELEENAIPEIQRTNLGNVVLMLKSLGINDLVGFDFMDPPPSETLIRALEQLYALGALNDRGELTKLGRRMAEFPLDPMLSKTLIASERFGVAEEIATICSMLSVSGAIFYRPKDKGVHADNAHHAFHRETNFSVQWCYENFVQARSMRTARDVRDQLVGLMERVEVEMCSNISDHDAIRKAITSGFFYHTANLQKEGSYKTVKSRQTVHIHPSSGLKEVLPRWVVYHELVMTSKEYMRNVSEIKPEWLIEIAPHYYNRKEIKEESSRKLPRVLGKAPMSSST